MTEIGYSLQYTLYSNKAIDQLCNDQIYVGYEGKLKFIEHVNNYIDEFNDDVLDDCPNEHIPHITDDIFKKVEENSNPYEGAHILYKTSEVILAIVKHNVVLV
jgi:hypothetical protein